MHTLLLIYQWAMYGGLLVLSATCVIVPLLKQAHDEARRAAHPKPHRNDHRIRTLRPIPKP